MRWLSRSIDALHEDVLAKRPEHPHKPDFDVIVVGSGYGGAVAAARFARAGYRVCILERGREYVPGEFPNQLSELAGQVRFRRADWGNRVANPLGMFDINVGPEVAMLTGNALGGGSQINANVGIRADVKVLAQQSWPAEIRADPNCLDGYYAEAERCLGIATYPNRQLPRFANLAELAREIGKIACREDWDDLGEPEVRCAPAPLAVTFKAGPNAFGIEQKACIECGDCVTGCNHWAKNTLTMNYLPDAVAHGAQAFTGATVVAIDPRNAAQRNSWRRRRGVPEEASDAGWKHVYLRRTEDVFRYQRDPTVDAATTVPDAVEVTSLPCLSAHIVVLAGGAVGSTEVLLRSKDLLDLRLSPALGMGFSANGDGLGFATLQDQPVHGLGLGAKPPVPGRTVGPTITGVIDTRDRVPLEKGMLIEDGAVPGAIGHLWQELLALGATLGQLDRWKVVNENNDRAGLHPEYGSHTQTLLMMGHDEAGGVLRLRDGHPVIRWPAAVDQAVGRRGHALAQAAEAQGGVYLRSAISNPLPPAMQAVLSGPEVKGVALTVHPLGGCRMGDSIELGVVSHRGEVFAGEGAGVYDGFFVWDGSIMPSSLGVNPFLTITALAERAVALVLTEAMRAGCARPAPVPVVLPQAPVVPPVPARTTTTGFEWHETLRGRLDGPDGANRVAALSLKLDIPDVTALVADPRHRVTRVSGNLRIAAADAETGTHSCVRHKEEVLYEVSGEIELMVPAPANPLWRRITAPWRYVRTFFVWAVKRRTELWEGIFSKQMARLPKIGKPKELFFGVRPVPHHQAGLTASEGPEAPAAHVGLRQKIRSHIRLVKHASDEREMRYRLVLERIGRPGPQYVLEARKRFAFRLGGNLWVDLTRLYVAKGDWNGTLDLSLRELADKDRPRMTGNVDLMEGFSRILSLPMLLVRTMLPMYLWDLRAPDLPSSARRLELLHESMEELDPLPGGNFRRSGRNLVMERHRFEVPARLPSNTKEDDSPPGKTLPLLLTRFQSQKTADIADDPASTKQAVILLHGFAQSSLAMAVPTMKVNLVQYLCAHGMDVWLLDYRTSTALASAFESHNLDHCAAIDVPEAVKFVRRLTGREDLYGKKSRLHLGGHCMGAAASGMALLSGRLVNDLTQPAETRLIDRMLLMQVPPVVIGTPYSQARREVAAVIRDTLGVKGVPLNASDGDSAMWTVLDRVFGTVPPPDGGGPECCPGERTLADIRRQAASRADRDVNSASALGQWLAIRRDTATCKRVSAIIGRLFLHENINDATHQNLERYFGFGNVDIFLQITKFFANEKYVDVHGHKRYLTEENIRRYGDLDILFLHGAKNFVFDPLSAKLSAMRFASVHGAARYSYAQIPGFAHFDCLVGDDDTTLEECERATGTEEQDLRDKHLAWKQVFPKVLAHLTGAETNPVSMEKVRSRMCLLPELGPYVGHIQAAAEGRAAAPGMARLRLWAKPDVTASILAPAQMLWVALDSSNGAVLAGACVNLGPGNLWQVGQIGERFAWLDVDVPAGVDLEIRVAFMHGEQDLTKSHSAAHVARRIAMHAGHLHKYKAMRDSEIEPPKSLINRRVRLLEDTVIQLSAAQLQGTIGAAPASVRLFLGSCRYPGTMLDRDRSDTTFNRMYKHMDSPDAAAPVASLLILAGDQIYSDARAGMFDLQSDLERYPQSYRVAWESPAFAKLLRRLPALMVQDDHEIGNDFSRDEMRRGTADPAAVARKVRYGRRFYKMFQESLGPAPQSNGLRTLTHGGYPMVLFDSRRRRNRADPLSPFEAMKLGSNTLGNVAALVAWLANQQSEHGNLPKFVVTGSVLFPGFVEADGDEGVPAAPGGKAAARIDNWQGFAKDRAVLLDGIARYGVANVVFLSGDYHCGVVATVDVRARPASGKEPLRAVAIATPALYAPLPFVNTRPHELIRNGVIAGPGFQAQYAQQAVFPADGFSEVLIEPDSTGWKLTLSMIGTALPPSVTTVALR